jgi:NADPH:quinone reductase-like Zn-dependent oxidoreductase
MRAVQISAFGGPEVLRLNDVPTPRPGAGEVLVAVEAASVNGHDVIVRSGALKLFSGRRFPIGVGLDFVGHATQVGDGVEHVRVDDRVWGTIHPRRRHAVGSCAEFVAVAQDRVATAPSQLPGPDAASLVVTGTTALTALRDILGLRTGETALIRGAAGGVGTAAVQLGRAMGATVTALAGQAHAGRLAELGADTVIDRHSVDLAAIGPYDVILDTVGSDLAQLRRRLGPGGRMATVALSPQVILSAAASTVHGRRRIRTFSANPLRPTLGDLTRYVESGAVRPVVAGVHAMSDVAEAQAAFERGGAFGKHVVAVGS